MRQAFCQQADTIPPVLLPLTHTMPLPSPEPRQHLHDRAVLYRGFKRQDGLWDIEGEMTDTKAYDMTMAERGDMPAGTPVHNMKIRVTLDDRFNIQAIVSSTDFAPFGECQRGVDPMQAMVGKNMGPGWRQTIEAALGGIKGCTHMRELLFNMATAAFQTIPVYRAHQHRLAGGPALTFKEPPYFLGKCIGWDFDGPVVARAFPQFVGWQPVKRVDKPAAEPVPATPVTSGPTPA